MNKLKLEPNLSIKRQKMAIDAALLLGFQTVAADFPVIEPNGDIVIPKTDEEMLNLWKMKGKPMPEGFEPASLHPGPLFDVDFRKERGLETIFTRGAFLRDENHDFLPDALEVKFILPEHVDCSMLTAACNIAFRLGMETTAYEGSLKAEQGYDGNAIIFEYSDKTEMFLEECKSSMRVHICGSGKELENFTEQLCRNFPQINGQRTWRDFLMDLTDDFILRGADGQLAVLEALRERQQGAYEVFGSPDWSDRQRKSVQGVSLHNYKSGQKVYEKQYEFPWEADVFENILSEEIIPRLKDDSRVKLAGALSEDKNVRAELLEKIQKKIEDKGAKLVKAEVICAYKQGFSWIDEIVIPEIKKDKPDKIEIYFKPFLPKGQTQWHDEDGARPKYSDFKEVNPDKWYDLPIRYLQELYPIEDVLVKELEIDRASVIFLPYDKDEDITYLVKASSESGYCYEASYQAQYNERPYMDEYPRLGKVHPSTGYIRVWVDDEEILFRKITTDVENIWNVYQKEVLPDCRKFIEEKTKGKINKEKQPFFNELRLDVTLSEPDYRVGCREDLISSLDALHEDMYFTAGDYFKNYGLQTAGVILDAPGLILPVIHHKKGGPVFKVTLSEQLKEKTCIIRDGKTAAKQRERDSVNLFINKISYENEKPAVTIRASGVDEDVLKKYAKLWEQGLIGRSKEPREIDVIRFDTKEKGIVCEIHTDEDEPEKKEKSILDIDLHEYEVIGYDMYLKIIEELKNVPGIEVFKTAVSYTGRDIYAIWLKPKTKGYMSMTKRLCACPSVIINARHHANEVSSTNASFMLLKRLLTEEKYQGLTEKLNLVLYPMANADGAAIHYELQKEHPYWKLHVARFNALGKEFFHEHFKADTIHSEAMGLTRLFEKFVPDMIVDNHGVPTHEWEQQFSGYTSPSYKGFWLPRSLLYGYFWYVTDPVYKESYKVCKRMEDVIADRIAEDEEMSRLNKEWSAQFEKYAHAWLPRLFPADYYKDMINYWVPFTYNPDHRYPSVRYPWITTVSYTSEVADETAQGEYLNLCARAHAAHDEATLQMLMQSENYFTCKCECRKGRIFAVYERVRPISATSAAER